jgi:hypothetical protein
MGAACVAPQTATDIKAETAIKKLMCFIVVLPRVNAGMTQQFQIVPRPLRHVRRDPPRLVAGEQLGGRSRRRSRSTFSGISVARLEAIGAGPLGGLARYFGPTDLPLEQVPNPEKATS